MYKAEMPYCFRSKKSSLLMTIAVTIIFILDFAAIIYTFHGHKHSYLIKMNSFLTVINVCNWAILISSGHRFYFGEDELPYRAPIYVLSVVQTILIIIVMSMAFAIHREMELIIGTMVNVLCTIIFIIINIFAAQKTPIDQNELLLPCEDDGEYSDV